MCSKTYNSKVVISGNIVEIYDYSQPILTEYKKPKKGGGRSGEADEENKEINREKVLNRARRDLRRLVNSNIGDNSKFVTLTFKENIQDIAEANGIFKNFIKRLNYRLGVKITYTCVPEFQKRGAIHYHVIMFNVPYIANKELQEIWGQGFVKINKIDEVDNVGAYICKYMSKDFDAADKLKGKKCYFSSRGLDKPIELKEKDLVESVRNSVQVQNLVYENTFTNDYNNISYKQYNIKHVNSK